ncbi:hypothetical protein J2Z22_002568 [Paenibacillus forsythiae]|uniref:Copper amine oxidase-like N-terminal domain-containing protein n=1 Tax=Paenibacillus forsythiae TaxID=365616 RepID=A0ABU3H876_9BACL|nr:stalk domain-containing protein [Paenibacillus forsythiae]MDT3427034.1 hypothetical protein [Paenibacillus forsythiae]
MLKKMIVTASLLLALPVSATDLLAATPPHIAANSKDYSASQFIIKENRAYCSIETLSSMMGALNSWVFKDEQSVHFITHFSKKGDSDEFYTWFTRSKKVEIMSKQGGEEKIKNITMKHQTVVSKDGEILIPLRDAILALGKSIEWESKSNTITITGKITY